MLSRAAAVFQQRSSADTDGNHPVPDPSDNKISNGYVFFLPLIRRRMNLGVCVTAMYSIKE
ncbi:MAG: hypothetical protein A2176_09550 [Spirochaetes bacterium RBG_13_51_14]|nr:MAG: hypothetical protein A2176_09550 [Spirochaetes bacterium RBG_13_51_14]